jgi:hypothetical protein
MKISHDHLPINTLQLGYHMSRPSNSATNRRIRTSRDALQPARFSTSYDPKDNNRRTQTFQDILQSARFSISYNPRDNNKRTQISQDVLQLERFLTSYDPRDNNRSTEGRREQERQTENTSIRDERGNSFGGKILIFFTRRKKNDLRYIDVPNNYLLNYKIIIYRIKILYQIKS